MKFDSTSYIEQMIPFLHYLPQHIHHSVFNPELVYYGTGESAHWPAQSNCNIFAALATLATAPDLPKDSPMPQAKIKELALQLLRYIMRTHKTGDALCTDGKQWGNHWISVLGLERMSHGLNLIRPFLTEDDQKRLRNLTESEADWLLKEYPVVANMVGTSGQNKPESNAWNGGYLLRAALDYPDLPNHDAYLEKSHSFLLNAISHPMDAACEKLFYGKPVREWHIGFNFTPNYGLDHHGYMNVGYMIITLSNLAMLHFNCKMQHQTPPAELYWHVRELWNVVKKFTFPDGRLLRIGGDTRSRYTYCQTYVIPVWLMIQDLYGETEASVLEKNYLDIIKTEQDDNQDGSFLSKRLTKLREVNLYYYCRLESDFFLGLSYGAAYRRLFDLPASDQKEYPLDATWQDDFEGAYLNRNKEAIRSFVWHGAQGPTGLCLPTNTSNIAEWQGNMQADLVTAQRAYCPEINHCNGIQFPNGFLTYGSHLWGEASPQGEGEGNDTFANHQSVIAALPDGKSMVLFERVTTTKMVQLKAVKGLHFLLPNDVYNHFKRTIKSEKGSLELQSRPGKQELISIQGDHLTLDNQVTIQAIYGGELAIYRPAEDNINICYRPFKMPNMYAEEIIVGGTLQNKIYDPGCVLIDGAYIVTVGDTPLSFKKLELKNGLQGAEVIGADEQKYSIIVNFDSKEKQYRDQTIKAGEALFLK